MALVEKESAKLWLGIGVGAGVTLAAPWVLPVLAAIARPLLKAAVSQSLVATERTREGLARFAETLSDVVAEVKAEAAERTLAEREALSAAIAGAGAGGDPSKKTRVAGEPN